MKTFGARIREIRVQNGQTVDELAEKIGVCPDAVWKLESGRRGRIYERVPRIARALGCSIQELFEGIEIDDDKNTETTDYQKNENMADDWED